MSSGSKDCIVGGEPGNEATPDYQQEIVNVMKHESKCEALSEGKCYIIIPLDEMKIKEDIVYDKTTGNMIGFCNLGSINDDLMRCE